MKFKHYKGGEYELVTLATDEETNEPLVVYKALSDGTVWSRPAKVFFGRVFVDGGGAIDRFSLTLPAGQALTCDAGCDHPKLKVEAFEFSREETTDGELLSSRSRPVWACRCGEEIHVYHEIDGSVTELDERPDGVVDLSRGDVAAQVDIPERVLDVLWQGARVSSYHSDGDQAEKLREYGRAVAAETLARGPK